MPASFQVLSQKLSTSSTPTPPYPRPDMETSPHSSISRQIPDWATLHPAPWLALPPSPGLPCNPLKGLPAPLLQSILPRNLKRFPNPQFPHQHLLAPRGSHPPGPPPNTQDPGLPEGLCICCSSPLQTQAQLLSFLNQLPLLSEASCCPFSSWILSFTSITSRSSCLIPLTVYLPRH